MFRAFRDRVLNRMTMGQGVVRWYYKHGPAGARWLEGHGTAKAVAYYGLVIIALPLKAVMFGHWSILVIIFLCVLGVLVVGKKLGWERSTAVITSLALAFSTVIVYSFMVEVPVAQASYSPMATYYYTVDHIGRPMNLRDESKNLRWYEQHYPFGEIINEDTLGDDMMAGAGNNEISWQPHFRFPGQFEDYDIYPFVNNHFRNYIPALGKYSTRDPVKLEDLLLPNPILPQFQFYYNFDRLSNNKFRSYLYSYIIYNPGVMNYNSYGLSNPVLYYDPTGEIFPAPLMVPVALFLIGMIIYQDVIAPLRDAAHGHEPHQPPPHTEDEPPGLPPNENNLPLGKMPIQPDKKKPSGPPPNRPCPRFGGGGRRK